MKKAMNILSVALAFIFSIVGLASIHIHSGNITSDETWTLAGSPILSRALTGVADGATLTIEPGVEVRFNKDATNARLSIGSSGTGTTGKLIAQGTETQKIIFTSNEASPQSGDWYSINFNSNASDDSIIENAIIEYGGVGGIIDISSSNPTIRNCIIRYALAYEKVSQEKTLPH